MASPSCRSIDSPAFEEKEGCRSEAWVIITILESNGDVNAIEITCIDYDDIMRSDIIF